MSACGSVQSALVSGQEKGCSIKRTFAIVGSRTYPADKEFYDSLTPEQQADIDIKGYQYVRNFMRHLVGNITVVSGGARGPDSWAAEIAGEMGFSVVEILPNWKKYGKGAGFHRNTEIVRAADDVVAFWDQVSNGTYDTIKKATEFKKDLIVFGHDGNILVTFTQDDYAKESSKLVIPRG